MGNKSKQVQTNQLGQYNPTDTADISNLRGLAQTGYDYETPIRNQYARAQQANDESYSNPLGAFTTADVADKSKRAGKLGLMQQEGMDLGDAAMQSQQNKFGQMQTVAQMTAPHVFNQSSTDENKMTGLDWVNMGANVGTSLLKAF